MSKPFKMKGNPFKRNFNIGETEAPDAETPLNSINWGEVVGKSLAAGMSTLPGGFDAYNQKAGESDDDNDNDDDNNEEEEEESVSSQIAAQIANLNEEDQKSISDQILKLQK